MIVFNKKKHYFVKFERRKFNLLGVLIAVDSLVLGIFSFKRVSTAKIRAMARKRRFKGSFFSQSKLKVQLLEVLLNKGDCFEVLKHF
jgi:hypothetical protein